MFRSFAPWEDRVRVPAQIWAMATLFGSFRSCYLTLDGRFRLVRGHWEVLTLEASCEKLLAAEAISRSDFENTLRDKLQPLA